MDETWAQWFRQNFDKILLFTAWLIGLGFVIYLMHRSAEPSILAWGRETAGTIMGAFLGLVTGSRLAAHSGSSSGDPQVVVTPSTPSITKVEVDNKEIPNKELVTTIPSKETEGDLKK